MKRLTLAFMVITSGACSSSPTSPGAPLEPTAVPKSASARMPPPPRTAPASLPASLTRHEIGHALGLIGLTPTAVPWVDRALSRYNGPLAIEGYRRTFGLIEPFLPADVHWKFIGNVMGAENDARISRASVGALMDMGYPAAWYGADR